MNFIETHIAIIVCLAGFALWHICLRLTDPPTGGADTGKIMFWVGLLAVLLGK